VLYIMGAGRSGSTILGVTLGNCTGVFFAGELDRWLVRGGVPQRRGDEELERLWREILATVNPPRELFGGVTTCLERSSALFHPRKLARRRRLRAPYRRYSQAVYRALAETTGANAIVDSSHYPLRARELRALPNIDLYLIYLMRDPQHVAASLGRRDVPERTFGLLAANAYLWLTSAVSTLVFLRHPPARRLFVRYESFVANPERVIAQILAHCELDAQVPDLARLHTGLTFHGNRLLESEVVKLDERSSEGVARSRLTALVQLPWLALASHLQPSAAG
jgi:Sulfotransferase family